MNRNYLYLSLFVVIIAMSLFPAKNNVLGFTSLTPSPQLTPTARIASPEALATAQAEWEGSAHSESYDLGMGANTTCARCKSPRNWDPYAEAADEALNCSSCKRLPGAPRPDLLQGMPVAEEDWMGITCDIRHEPSGDSFSVDISYWNNEKQQYEIVDSTTELCAHCHEGQHGFEVIEEMRQSPVHKSLECVDCHGPHGSSTKCDDCHDPTTGDGAQDHESHTAINCTACHDAGGLTIWLDIQENSRHYNEFIPVRFAHTLTSWPSHNLQTTVNCVRCHHPSQSSKGRVLAQDVSCEVCHENGAMFIWCENFPRDENPLSDYDWVR